LSVDGVDYLRFHERDHRAVAGDALRDSTRQSRVAGGMGLGTSRLK
jgi:hypothetical protein